MLGMDRPGSRNTVLCLASAGITSGGKLDLRVPESGNNGKVDLSVPLSGGNNVDLSVAVLVICVNILMSPSSRAVTQNIFLHKFFNSDLI